MNCTKFFIFVLSIVILSYTIECRRKDITSYLRSIKENSNNKLPETSVHVSGNCQGNGDCPLGYTCTNSMCIKQVIKTSHRAWKLLQCSDTDKDCQKYKNYCRDSAYLDFLRQRCKRTCGYCPGS